MQPILAANNPNIGSLIALISDQKASYSSINNKFGQCIESFQGGSVYLNSKNSSITDQLSIYGFSASVYGGNFYCLNCYVFDVEQPTFAFTVSYQGGLAYLDYDDSDTIDTSIITFNFQKYIITGVIGWYAGGFINIQGSYKSFNIIFKDNLIQGSETGFESYISNGQYGGGCIYVIGGYINITIQNSTFKQIDGQTNGYGAVLYIYSGSEIDVKISNSTFVSVTSPYKGQIIYGNAANEINVYLENSIFNGANTSYSSFVDMTQNEIEESVTEVSVGSGFYLRSENKYFTNYTSKNNTFIQFLNGGSSGQDLAGAVFSLNQNQTFTDYGSNFSYCTATEGGVFYCSQCNITLYNTNVFSVLSERGGFIFVDSDQIYLTMINSTVSYNMVNDAGGFIYFMQLITSPLEGFMIFEHVNFNHIGAYFGGGLMALNCEKCNVTFKSCNLSKSGVAGLDSGTGSVNDGGFFNIKGVNQFLLQDTNFQDLDVSSLVQIFIATSNISKDAAQYQANFGTLILYSEITKSSVFTFQNVQITFSTTTTSQEYIANLISMGTSNIRSVVNTYQYLTQINCQNAVSCKVISKNSDYKNNFMGRSGAIFNFVSVDFYESGTIYSQNAAVTGGTITAQDSNLTISNSTYSYNYAYSGGVFNLIDQCNVKVSSSTFFANGAKYRGGIFDVILATSSSNDQTTIVIKDSTFNDILAFKIGGAISLENENVGLIVQNNVFDNVTTFDSFGGVFSLTNALYANFINNQFTYLTGKGNGNLLYANSDLIQNITFIDNYVLCQSIFDQLEVTNFFSNGTNYLYQNTIYISQVQNVISSNNQFQYCIYNNQGGVFFLDQTNMSDSGSLFLQNSAYNGGVIQCNQCNLVLYESVFTNNFAFQGAVIILDSSSTMQADYIQMTKNQAQYQGGCILVRTNSYFTINDSKFISNIANTSSSVIQALSSSNTKYLTIYASLFQGNFAVQNTLTIQYAKIKIIACTFIDNNSTQQSKNLFLGFSEVIIQGTTFKNTLRQLQQFNKTGFQYVYLDQFELIKNDQTTGSFIQCILDVNLTISYSIFQYGYSSVGGAIYVSGYSNVQIKKSQFYRNFANTYAGAIYGTGFALIQVDTGTTFIDDYAVLLGDDIFVRNSDNITLVNCTFQSQYSTNPLYFETIDGTLKNIIVRNNDQNNVTTYSGGGLFCLDCIGLNIVGSQFLNLKAFTGGCVFIIQTSNSNGGIVFAQNIQNLQISDSVFINGSTPKLGGGIYYQCDFLNDSFCIINITGKVNFTNNSAGISGGAIFWNDVEPLTAFGKLTYQNNSAIIYGDDIACFSQRLATVSYQQLLAARGQIDDQSSLRFLLDTSTPSTNSTLQQVRSGQTLPDMYLALVDKYGQIVKTDATKNGTFLLQDVQFTATPGYNYKVQLQTDGIDMTKPSNKAYLQQLQSQSSNTTDITFSVLINLRECQIGEQFTDSGQCIGCSSSSQYLLVQLNSPGSCLTCPVDQATCLGGSDIGPKPGYWRKNNLTDDFIQCLRVASCLGMIEPDMNPIGSCQEGYRGVLCADCIEGYSRSGDYGCAQCPGRIWNAFRLILVVLGVAFFLVLLIRSTLRGATARKNVMSIYTKIMMNHIQLLIIASSFDFEWPYLIQNFYDSIKPVSQVSQQILSVDCLIADQQTSGEGYSYNAFQADSFFRIIYTKTITMAVVPIILHITNTLGWSIILWGKATLSEIRVKSMSSMVIMMFFIYSNIVQMMLDMFNCMEVDGDKRLKVDLEVICYQGPHRIWAFLVAIPALLVWGLSIPIFSYILLTRHKAKLDTYDIKAKYGFIYRGYKLRFYYYESVVMYRKSLLVFVSVFMVSSGVIVQALVVFILLIFSMSKQLMLKPYQTQALNLLELLSIFSSGITIYIGIFFIIDNSTKDMTSSNPFKFTGLDETSKYFFFFVIISSNALFFLMWTYYFLIELKEFFIKKMGWLYLRVILCGNRKKLVLHQNQMLEKEENEVLREEYVNTLKKLKKAYDRGDLILNQTVLERIKVYLNLNRVYENIGLKKDHLDNEHTHMRKQRLKQDRENQEALNSSFSFNVDKEAQKIIQYHLQQKETLIENIDIDFDQRSNLRNLSRTKPINISFLDSYNNTPPDSNPLKSKKKSKFLVQKSSTGNYHVRQQNQYQDQILGNLAQTARKMTNQDSIDTSREDQPDQEEELKFKQQSYHKINSNSSDKIPSSISQNLRPILEQYEDLDIQQQFEDIFNRVETNRNFLKQDKTSIFRSKQKGVQSQVNRFLSLSNQIKSSKMKQNNRYDQNPAQKQKLQGSGRTLLNSEDEGFDSFRQDEVIQSLDDNIQEMIYQVKEELDQFEEKDQLYFVKGSKRKMNLQDFKRKRELMMTLRGSEKYHRIRKAKDAINFINNLSKDTSLHKEPSLRPQLTILQGEISENETMKALRKKKTFRKIKNNYIQSGTTRNSIEIEIHDFIEESARDLIKQKDKQSSQVYIENIDEQEENKYREQNLMRTQSLESFDKGKNDNIDNYPIQIGFEAHMTQRNHSAQQNNQQVSNINLPTKRPQTTEINQISSSNSKISNETSSQKLNLSKNNFLDQIIRSPQSHLSNQNYQQSNSTKEQKNSLKQAKIEDERTAKLKQFNTPTAHDSAAHDSETHKVKIYIDQDKDEKEKGSNSLEKLMISSQNLSNVPDDEIDQEIMDYLRLKSKRAFESNKDFDLNQNSKSATQINKIEISQNNPKENYGLNSHKDFNY